MPVSGFRSFGHSIASGTYNDKENLTRVNAASPAFCRRPAGLGDAIVRTGVMRVFGARLRTVLSRASKRSRSPFARGSALPHWYEQ